VTRAEVVVPGCPFRGESGIVQEPPGERQRGIADEPVEPDHPEPARADVDLVRGVVVHEDRPPVVDSLEEGVAEALERRWVRDEIRGRIDVGERVDAASVVGGAGMLAHDLRFEPDVDAEETGELTNPGFVLEPLVAGRM
jgi:hypothetical protein